MIPRFRKVNSNLYRGGAPSIKDIGVLKKLGIRKIVSLDEASGKKIDRATKLLGIKHIMAPIDIYKRGSLLKFLGTNVERLLTTDGPTFLHCAAGKDRTGLAIAIYRCKHDGWSCGKAIKEAKSLGFGIGVDPKVVALYIKVIQKACGCKEKDMHDVSFAYDIVSNEREDLSDGQNYTLGPDEQQSWAPYADYRVREFPYAKTEIDWPEQYQSRIDYGLDDSDSLKGYQDKPIPQSGQYDTSTNGINGAGPSLIGGGYV